MAIPNTNFDWGNLGNWWGGIPEIKPMAGIAGLTPAMQIEAAGRNGGVGLDLTKYQGTPDIPGTLGSAAQPGMFDKIGGMDGIAMAGKGLLAALNFMNSRKMLGMYGDDMRIKKAQYEREEAFRNRDYEYQQQVRRDDAAGAASGYSSLAGYGA